MLDVAGHAARVNASTSLDLQYRRVRCSTTMLYLAGAILVAPRRGYCELVYRFSGARSSPSHLSISQRLAYEAFMKSALLALITAALVLPTLAEAADEGGTIDVALLKPLCDDYAAGLPQAKVQFDDLKRSGLDMDEACRRAALLPAPSPLQIATGEDVESPAPVEATEPKIAATPAAPLDESGATGPRDECISNLRGAADLDAFKKGYNVVRLDQGEYSHGADGALKCSGQFLILKGGKSGFSQVYSSQVEKR